ncbi:hypothetical protein [Brevundimonas sp. Root1423]|uniref:hypothetical protein n=1 Tax=Brevundimonas sp. Root1423 TaxID=1736462 RepID=UPI0006FE3B97|nr:hypothetical protein [Brevundimonas sp. Root1423]KQY96677.1 hypothetical protein ASD25_02245 [Brevundimonas sp. Root1423]
MGHIESGGAAEGQVTSGVWPLWKRLKTYFPTWSLLPSSFVTPGAWGYMGNDFVTGFRQNRSTHQAFELLDGVTDRDFDALSALASLNARRQDQMLRAVVIAYLTVPLSIVAIVAEVAGGSLITLVRDHSDWAIQTAVAITTGPVFFFMSHWRSRQIVAVLDLIRIERGQSPYTALELRED